MRSEFERYDCIVVGSGPNGLGAAITLAQAGLSTVVLEANDTIGGGVRTAELILPGFRHDLCSAVHPFAAASPFLSRLPMVDHGLNWVQPVLALAHPFDDGSAAVLGTLVSSTAGSLGCDRDVYRKWITPLLLHWDELLAYVVGDIRLPRRPLTAIRFGTMVFRSARALAEGNFRGKEARGLLAGLGAHAVVPLEAAPGAAVAVALILMAHSTGWPIPSGGAQAVTDSLASYFRSLGGRIVTGCRVQSLAELPSGKGVFLDITPRQLLRIGGRELPGSYRRRLGRYRYGPGVFKMDWALREPIPWRSQACREAGTVHVGGTLEEIAEAERAVSDGKHPERPFVILSQPSLFDPTRAPPGAHVAWGYCHVPNGSDVDMGMKIEAQVERFAPGFRDVVLARRAAGPAELEQENENHVGGDITGGSQDLRQVLVRVPYKTPLKDVLLCSSSTVPGAGVHGLCGHRAALVYLRERLGRSR